MAAIEDQIENVVDMILDDYQNHRDIDKIDLSRDPDKDVVIDIIHKLQRIVFPGYFRDRNYRIYNAKHNLSMLIEDVMFNLNRQIVLVLQGRGEPQAQAEEKAQHICLEFFKTIPQVRAVVQTDLQASYDGDPAASGKDEIIFSYPGLFAIVVYRLAHVLYNLKVPMLPRMMTEHAHSVTGIDIHPGATIGEYFFIDHGTGIVIGDHCDRRPGEDLSGCDVGCFDYPGRAESAGQAPPSHHRGQCDHLCRRFHFGRRNGDRPGFGHWFQCLYYPIYCARHDGEH